MFDPEPKNLDARSLKFEFWLHSPDRKKSFPSIESDTEIFAETEYAFRLLDKHHELLFRYKLIHNTSNYAVRLFWGVDLSRFQTLRNANNVGW